MEECRCTWVVLRHLFHWEKNNAEGLNDFCRYFFCYKRTYCSYLSTIEEYVEVITTSLAEYGEWKKSKTKKKTEE